MKKTIGIIVGIIVALALIFGYLLWSTNPTRALNAFIADIEAGEGVTATTDEAGVKTDATGAYSYIGPDVKDSKMENIEFFLEDWLIAEKIETAFVSDEAWRTKVILDENKEPELNKYGYEKKEIMPTPKWWAHHYEAYVDVNFSDTEDLEEGFEDPVIIKLKRQTDNATSRFSQLFRPWKVTQIKYQPFDDEDYEDIEFDAEDLLDLDEIDLSEDEDGEFTFELDENGEVVASDEKATDEDGDIDEESDDTENTDTVDDETVDEGTVDDESIDDEEIIDDTTGLFE